MADDAIYLTYSSAADVAAHLAEQDGALLVRLADAEELAQQVTLTLEIRCPEGCATVGAQLLQLLPGLGLVLRLTESTEVEALVGNATPSPAPQAPEVSRHRAKAGGPPAGSSVLSWGIERLQAEWPQLSQAQRIRLARHGDRPSRALVLRSQDKTLHAFLLKNPKIGADEVAHMAQLVNLDPNLLRQIATSPEWVRHSQVARNLVSHPKLPLPIVQKVVPSLSLDEMRRLTRTGKVRASVKRVLMQRITKGR